MKPVQKAALWFGVANLVIGLAGFVGPLVTGNDDGFININPGLLFGIFGMNWLHAIAHILFGAGIVVSQSCDASRTFMWASAVVFGLLTVMGLVMFGMEMEPQIMLGMASNGADNLLHLLWTGITLYFAVQASRAKVPEARCA